MHRNRLKKEEDQRDRSFYSSGWMITFSDLSTLLLTFFVLLVSMSSLNRRVFRNTFQNFDSSSGILFFKEKDPVASPKNLVIQDICKSLDSVHVVDIRDLDDVSEKEFKDNTFNLVVSSGGGSWTKKSATDSFSFMFESKLLFESGSTTLNPSAFPMLEKLANFLNESDFRAYIYGHTDNTPVSSDRFASNDTLSIARAHSVLDFFLNRCKVNPGKLALGGYGSSVPLANGFSPAANAMNRRVEIIFEKADL